jgi:benzylsuccinate CoA-transferase BbsE subunit
MDAALAGVRVLDLADQTGALAGRLLADLGADVILVEPPGGSLLRRIPPFWRGVEAAERSLFFWFYGTGKRGITLDPARPQGMDLLVRLATAVDVVIETGPPGRLDALLAANPRLVLVSITPFGQQGPYRDWRSSNLVAQAMGGMLYVSGHADGPPLAALGVQAYHQAAIFAAVGTVSALLAREASGRGQHVDVSLQAAVAGALEHVPGFWHQAGLVGHRQGTLHWTRYFRVGRCKDGWVMHCTLGDWTSLVEWVKADGMADDLGAPEWEDIRQRQTGAEHLFDVLDRWAARYTVAELHEGAQLRRIPYAAVRAPEALLRDQHLAERGFFVPIEHPDLGIEVPYPGPPFRPEGRSPARRPPRLGEHSAEVYGALAGLTRAELASLAEQRVV